MESLQRWALAKWCKGWWVREAGGGEDGLPVRGVTVDSREAGEGTVFFALPGERTDGHRYAGEVAARGGVAVVRRDLVPEVMEMAGDIQTGGLLEVADPGDALVAFGRGYRRIQRARVVGVTGSVGKTSTKELVADLLSTLGKTVRTGGNYNNRIGLPLSLSKLEAGVEYGVFEAGISHPGEMAELADAMGPDAAVVGRVGPVHIEFFRDEEGIAEEKAGLVAAVPAKGFAVLDADGAHFGTFARRCKCRVVRCARAGWKGESDYWGEEAGEGWLRVRETATGEEAVLPVPPPGGYMAENVLRAVACARQWGAGWEAMGEALRGWRSVGMRWAVGEGAGGTRVVNDAYNANPMSMRAAAEAFAKWEEGRVGARWLALGPMLELGERGEEEHRSLGAWLARKGGWGGLAVGGWREDARGLAEALAEGWRQGGGDAEAVRVAGSPEEAREWLAARMRKGDAVLLKGSRGLRMEQVAATGEG